MSKRVFKTELDQVNTTLQAQVNNSISKTIVDAKGDIVTASAADTPIRLAVGTNEHRLVADSATTSGLKYVADTTNYAVGAKGDLLVGTAADTVTNLAVASTAGWVLTVDSATTSGLKWAAVAAGGKVLQVVEVEYSTSTTIASTTPTDTGLSGSITPSSTSSKVLVFVQQMYRLSRANQEQIAGYYKLFRGATEIIAGNEYLEIISGTNTTENQAIKDSFFTVKLDSPNTTSATTYKTQLYVQTTAQSGQIVAQPSSTVSRLILMEIGA